MVCTYMLKVKNEKILYVAHEFTWLHKVHFTNEESDWVKWATRVPNEFSKYILMKFPCCIYIVILHVKSEKIIYRGRVYMAPRK